MLPTSAQAIAPTSDSESHRRQRRADVAPTSEPDRTESRRSTARSLGTSAKQVAFGPRPSGTPAIVETRKYIIEQLKASGIEAQEQAFIGDDAARRGLDGQRHRHHSRASGPSGSMLASHYDTKLFRDFRFVGANDGASSTAALLELGRVLKARQNELTIELLFLDGEEARMPEWRGTDNTYGSRHYVEAAQKDGSLKSLKALVLLDMIGDRDLHHQTRLELHALARGHHLGCGRPRSATPARSPTQLTRSRTTTCRSCARASPSVDIIDLEIPDLAHARRTTSTTSARAACRSSATSCSPRIPEIEKRIVSGK